MRARPTLSALAALALLTGCGSTEEPASADAQGEAPAGAFPVEVAHTFGSTTIEEQPERVVVLGWSAQDTLYALGVDPVGMPTYTWGGGDDGVVPWNDEHYDPDVTTLLDTADGPPLEEIAALRPDVILAPYEGFDESVYLDLSAIAPTVAYPDQPWTTPWREQTRMIGTALGRAEEAEQLIADTEQQVAGVAAEHPEFEGLSFAYTSLGADALYLYLPTDPRVQLVEDLGLELAPSVAELAGDDAESFYAQLSLEEAPEIESDVLIGWTDGLTVEEVLTSELYASVPAIQRNAAVVLDDTGFAAAASMVSPLSIPYTLDQLVDRLAEAAANASS
ncbi:iron-siderophore ABC transporter substrate-binding protein [Geodermatophilus sp. YIM 151500]|uniref:iron-siderophore ABC transporter substrate-binding protein n=1 Tax=Geodermatophilus sp. YIM 151500 TaxID=2984531 RepID=UPI0021E3B2B7|nr:iron-siderophore ABC transporter substrate-binding protein [Geodermatophilus sp. YIM 151500]MCV2491612.1 iron-siderophore ABC transporter substrate-binding protein [Geodermatophilus sp. YIM 151500]